MNKKAIKVIGIAASVIGFGLSLLTDWVADKKLDEKIDTKVAEALAKSASEIES